VQKQEIEYCYRGTIYQGELSHMSVMLCNAPKNYNVAGGSIRMHCSVCRLCLLVPRTSTVQICIQRFLQNPKLRCTTRTTSSFFLPLIVGYWIHRTIGPQSDVFPAARDRMIVWNLASPSWSSSMSGRTVIT